MELEILTYLIPLIVPYVTAAIKKGWLLVMTSIPRWMGPLKAIVAGWIVAGLSKAVGIPLPANLGEITDETTTSILMGGAVLGAIGALIRNFFNGLKKEYGPETAIGGIIIKIAGRLEDGPPLSKRTWR